MTLSLAPAALVVLPLGPSCLTRAYRFNAALDTIKDDRGLSNVQRHYTDEQLVQVRMLTASCVGAVLSCLHRRGRQSHHVTVCTTHLPSTVHALTPVLKIIAVAAEQLSRQAGVPNLTQHRVLSSKLAYGTAASA
jgi:hypothetical protein